MVFETMSATKTGDVCCHLLYLIQLCLFQKLLPHIILLTSLQQKKTTLNTCKFKCSLHCLLIGNGPIHNLVMKLTVFSLQNNYHNIIGAISLSVTTSPIAHFSSPTKASWPFGHQPLISGSDSISIVLYPVPFEEENFLGTRLMSAVLSLVSMQVLAMKEVCQ